MIGDPAGGGIFNQGGSVTGANCVFSGNTAKNNSGAWPPGSPSRTRGGALCNGSGEIRLESCSFSSNSVAGAPGAFNGGDAALEGNGGAVANSGTLEGNLCTFLANSATGGTGGGSGGGGGAGNGGAVWNAGILELSDSTFLSNVVSGGLGGEGGGEIEFPFGGGPGGPGGRGNGGGLFNAGATTVAGCLFTGNVGSGGDGGGGGWGAEGSEPVGPGAGAGGNGGDGGWACGAICDINGLCLLTNCTLSSNSGIAGAGGPGGLGGTGGRYGYPNGADGQAGQDGQAVGGLRSIGAIVMDTVLAGNAPGGDCSGTFTDAGENSSSDGSCGFRNQTVPTANASTLPLFYLLHNFTGQEAFYVDAHPFGPLVPSPDGTFYGTTYGDPRPGPGAVFMVESNGTDSGFTVLHGFDGGDPRNGASGTLALSGNVLYGTTQIGGQSNQGSIFKINTDGSGYETLYSFTGAGGDGAWPEAGLVLSGSSLFGTTTLGGSPGLGTIFKIQTDGSGYGVMERFPGGTNGGGPEGELLLSGSTLYGTTVGDGGYSASTVFKIDTDGSGFTVLKSLDAVSSGATFWAGLAISGPTLFGTTASDCYNYRQCGALFKMNTDGSGFTILKQFPASDSPGPGAGPIFSGGKLYGTTWGDGSLTNGGSVFMMNADGSGYTVLKQFRGMDGSGPAGNLLLLGNTLYGTTQNGGFYGAGVAFALLLSSAALAGPPVSIQRMPAGITIAFAGTLQSADRLTGPWSDLPGASPQIITPAGAMKFYRARY